MKKFDLMTLPPMEGQLIVDEVTPNEFIPKGTISKESCRQAVPLRQMVNTLVELLVDEFILMNYAVTCSNLPKEIPKAIRGKHAS